MMLGLPLAGSRTLLGVTGFIFSPRRTKLGPPARKLPLHTTSLLAALAPTRPTHSITCREGAASRCRRTSCPPTTLCA